MSWPDLMSPWQGEPPPGPAPDLFPAFLVLAGLADVITGYLAMAAVCADCRNLATPCPDHEADAELAADCHAVYMHLAGIGSDGAMLAFTGGLT